MSKQPTGLVTKTEALRMVTRFINKPGVMDLPDIIELLTWQTKLTLWVLQESNQHLKNDGFGSKK